MSKSWIEHYKKKYPGGRVHSTDSSLDVYTKDGEHAVALRKNGHGNLVCQSEEHGTLHAHDLAPIPKKVKPEHVCEKTGKVKSCAEIGLHLFDENQRAVKEE